MPENVVIYRIGSIGDIAVALPALRLVARAFPDANRVLLTNFLAGARDAPAKAIIGDTGLVQDYLHYPIGTRDPRDFWRIRRRIASLRPTALIYLASRRSLTSVLRDVLFFRACGARRIIGAPLARDVRNARHHASSGLWEQEGLRLVRSLASIGRCEVDDRATWSLELTDPERRAASEALHGWSGKTRFVALAAGAKVDAKDWTADNWRTVVSQLTRRYPRLGLALIGAGSERERAELLAAAWQGPTINLCGSLPPRISAAVMERANLFVGHDGGPMHLAAAVGVPIVAVFSARARPGRWFPVASAAEILYRDVPCAGCNLDACVVERKRCILGISPDQVVAACCRLLDGAMSENAGAVLGLRR